MNTSIVVAARHAVFATVDKKTTRHRRLGMTLAYIVMMQALFSSSMSQPAAAQTLPWMDPSLSPEVRTELLLGTMSLDQKIEQMGNNPRPNEELPGCEFTSVGRHIEGIPELAIPTYRAINGGTGMRGGRLSSGADCDGSPQRHAGCRHVQPCDQLRVGWSPWPGSL